MDTICLSSPVSCLNGVGKTRLNELKKRGIESISDLIHLFPCRYEDRANVRELNTPDLENACSYELTVATSVKTSRIANGKILSKFKAFDRTGSCDIIFFNSQYVKGTFRIGDTFRFYGQATYSKNKILTIANPKFDQIIANTKPDNFVPIYRNIPGISSKMLNKIIKEALSKVEEEIIESLPQRILESENLIGVKEALNYIHAPESYDQISRAKKRFSFENYFSIALQIALRKREKIDCVGAAFKSCDFEPLLKLIPYELTNSQKEAINDIYRDTVIKKIDGLTPAMSRIIVGDVGCGKTICAIFALYISYMSGYQSVMMAPTEILAKQHYEQVKKLFSSLNINVELLTGSTPLSHKKDIYNKAENGLIDVVIGTHALISDKLNFKNLGLVITDEQHRFGVMQRARLKTKSEYAHMLVMSATPIPRTLALALYGDLDISKITDMPKGRQKVDTYVVDNSYTKRVHNFILNQVSDGGQCYVICPSIEQDEDEVQNSHLISATEYTDLLRNEFPQLNVECIHGRLKKDEINRIMAEFANNSVQILVSTTVIEVGIDVPNASLIVINNAERFGLSQLHQLRGRVGRGNRKSYCVLVSGSKSSKSTSRLEVMKTTYDGYEIADKDLMLRGPGDFVSLDTGNSLRQSGSADMKFLTSESEFEIFKRSFELANRILNEDPKLSHHDFDKIKSSLIKFYNFSSTIS